MPELSDMAMDESFKAWKWRIFGAPLRWRSPLNPR
jgi:hypothetical protein